MDVGISRMLLQRISSEFANLFAHISDVPSKIRLRRRLHTTRRNLVASFLGSLRSTSCLDTEAGQICGLEVGNIHCESRKCRFCSNPRWLLVDFAFRNRVQGRSDTMRCKEAL